MKKNFLKYIFLSCTVAVLFSACRKDDYSTTETGDNGTSFVRIFESKVKANFYDAFTDVKTTTLFNIRKDAANNADLKKATTVTLTDLGQTYLNKYNAEHGTTLEIMPTTVYTLANTAVTVKTSTGIDVVFPGGADIESFTVKIDGSKLSADKKYALAYVITDADGLKTKVGRDTIITTVGVKNKYDGTYLATGVFNHPTAGPRDINETKALVTVSQNAVSAKIADLAGTTMIITIDPATNNVTLEGNANGAANGNLMLVPGSTNKYDPATQTFTLNYRYGTDPAYRVVTEKLTRQ